MPQTTNLTPRVLASVTFCRPLFLQLPGEVAKDIVTLATARRQYALTYSPGQALVTLWRRGETGLPTSREFAFPLGGVAGMAFEPNSAPEVLAELERLGAFDVGTEQMARAEFRAGNFEGTEKVEDRTGTMVSRAVLGKTPVALFIDGEVKSERNLDTARMGGRLLWNPEMEWLEVFGRKGALGCVVLGTMVDFMRFASPLPVKREAPKPAPTDEQPEKRSTRAKPPPPASLLGAKP
jgi:hypothetical protein